MKHKPQAKNKRASNGTMQHHWHEMNRKQRRETMRQIQSEDLSLEVIHPDAAGIDIGNETHYVAVPPNRDSQPVRRFGCTTAELKAMAAWLKQCRDSTSARNLRSFEQAWSRYAPRSFGSRSRAALTISLIFGHCSGVAMLPLLHLPG
jgi:hypothetical protein